VRLQFFFAESGARVTTVETDANWWEYMHHQAKNYSNLDVEMFPFEGIELKESVSLSHLMNLGPDLEMWPEFQGLHNSNFDNKLIAMIEAADFIFIDGGPRNTWLELVSRYSNPKCILMVDNTDRIEWKNGLLTLESAGFVEIPFHGLGPLNPYAWTTSFFVRSFEGLAAIFTSRYA